MKFSATKHPIRSFLKTSVVLLVLSGCDKTKTYRVQTEHVDVTSLDQIVPVSDSLVLPITYGNITGLENLPVEKSKAKFISAVLPAVLIAKQEVETTRIKIKSLLKRKHWDQSDSLFFNTTKEKYRAADAQDLLVRLETMPTSLVLAQAILESGWGQSRFFIQANNIFGIWSYHDDEPRIAARLRRKDRTIYLKKYDDILSSVRDYFLQLATARAYRGLRKAMTETDDPLKLLPHLKYYSERRNAYVNQLKRVILHNDLTQYDHYKIDPQYLVEE